MSHGYEVGSEHVRMLLGIEKTAVREVTPEEAGVTGASPEEEGMGAALPAAAVAGALPFAGMIGQKKLKNDPFLGAQGANYKTMEELASAAMPGDVILTAKPKGSIWRNFQLPVSGSEWYHAQGVPDVVPGTGTLSWDDLLDLPEEQLEDFFGMGTEELAEIPKKDQAAALQSAQDKWGKAKGLTWEAGEIALHADELKDYFGQGMQPHEIYQAEGGGIKDLAQQMKAKYYEDVALLRPKTPMTPAQLTAYQNDMMVRGTQKYENAKALELYLKDLFVPKIKGMEKLLGSQTPTCQGNVCSTTPAQSFSTATGKTILEGKRPQDIAPADFLRSNEFELVGSKMDSKKFRLKPGIRKALPWLTRGGLGAGMAAGAYTAVEEPASMAAIPGAVGTYLAGRKITDRLSKKPGMTARMFPNVSEGVGTVADLMMHGVPLKEKLKALKPLAVGGGTALAGGLAAYGGAKGMGHLYDKHVADSMPWNE